jgi:glutamine synthetase
VSLTRAQMSINLLEQMVPIEGFGTGGRDPARARPVDLTVLPWAPGSASVPGDQLGHRPPELGRVCGRSYL